VNSRSVAATVALSAMLLGTAACSSGSSGSDGGSAGGKVTLKYWASNQGTSLANDKEVLTPVLAAFKKKTGIDVNMEVIGWPDLQTPDGGDLRPGA
jgi:multiple sugar transport system substrate-binding protein